MVGEAQETTVRVGGALVDEGGDVGEKVGKYRLMGPKER